MGGEGGGRWTLEVRWEAKGRGGGRRPWEVQAEVGAPRRVAELKLPIKEMPN